MLCLFHLYKVRSAYKANANMSTYEIKPEDVSYNFNGFSVGSSTEKSFIIIYFIEVLFPWVLWNLAAYIIEIPEDEHTTIR